MLWESLTWECVKCGNRDSYSDAVAVPNQCKCGSRGLMPLLPGVDCVQGEEDTDLVVRHMMAAEVEAIAQYEEDRFLHRPKPDTEFDDYDPDEDYNDYDGYDDEEDYDV